MKSDAARNGGASNTGTGYLPFTPAAMYDSYLRALRSERPFSQLEPLIYDSSAISFFFT